jgi:enoyl-CoA hydratase/carnithine racemase
MISETETIDYEVQGKIATITINRPEKMNSFRIHEFNLIINSISLATYNENVNVIKIRSKGERAFTGGLDLGMIAELASAQEKIQELLITGEKIFKAIIKCPKPIVVEVQGPAVGWGTVMCLLADFVIAGDNPKTFFVLNEIDVGIFPGTGALTVALTKTSLKQAKRMLLIPEKIFLSKADNIVTKIVPLSNLASETEEFCQNLASKANNILFPIKIVLNKLHLNDLDNFFKMEREGFKMFMNNNFEEMMKFTEEIWKKS